MPRVLAAISVIMLFLSMPTPALPEPVLPTALKNVGFDQRLNERVPLDLEFLDEDGRSVHLRDYFGKKPVILNLVYYRCPMLCTKVLNGMVQGLRETSFTPGNEFEIVTVSIDPKETPAQAAVKKLNYIRYYGDPKAAAGWHFLTGDESSIEQLAKSVGFRYQFDPKSGEFAHPAGLVVLTSTGVISRYFYDVSFSGRDLRLGLVEASQNKIGSPIDQVLLFCFHYDPSAGKYGAAIMNLVRVGGVCTMVTLALFFRWLFRTDSQRRAQQHVIAIDMIHEQA